MAETKLRVGFIGLGAMGRPMAERLLERGFPLTVCPHRNRGPVEVLAARGAAVALDPAGVAAAADVVITMVPDAPQLEEAVLGPRGLAAGAHPGLTLIDMSTVPPAASRRIGARLAEAGVAMLDAPVSGGPKRAAEGSLSIMVGGDPEALARVRPVLDALGSRIVHLGPLGMGEVAKLANNVLLAGVLVANSEALAFGVKAGIPAKTLREVLLAGTATNWILEHWLPQNVLQGVYEPAGFALSLMRKDLSAALATARELGVPLFQAALDEQLFTFSEGQGRGSWDFSAIARLYEDGAKVEIASGEWREAKP